MNNTLKNDIVSSLVSIAYYWMGEQNPQATWSTLKLLQSLELSGKTLKKVDDLESDFKTFFKTNGEEFIEMEVVIPNDKDTEEKKLLWIAGVSLMNLFKCGNFELAYTMLMDMSLNWESLYTSVVNTLKNQDFKNELAQWLMTHFYMACDLLGTDEINMLGYTVKKN